MSLGRLRIVVPFGGLLLCHAAHVVEEFMGHFFLMDSVFGPVWFLVVNAVLFCIAVVLFLGILRGQYWALRMGMLYAAIMVMNGFMHAVGWAVTGRYIGGFAGAVSGLGLTATGVWLLMALRRVVKSGRATDC